MQFLAQPLATRDGFEKLCRYVDERSHRYHTHLMSVFVSAGLPPFFKACKFYVCSDVPHTHTPEAG